MAEKIDKQELENALARDREMAEAQEINSVQTLRLVHPVNKANANPPVAYDARIIREESRKTKCPWGILFVIGLAGAILLPIIGIYSESILMMILGIALAIPCIALMVWRIKVIRGIRAEANEYLWTIYQEIKTLELKGYGVSSDKHHKFVQKYFGIDLPTVMAISANS